MSEKGFKETTVDDVDGSEIRQENQLRLVVYPIIYEGFYKSQVVSRVSSINSRKPFKKTLNRHVDCISTQKNNPCHIKRNSEFCDVVCFYFLEAVQVGET